MEREVEWASEAWSELRAVPVSDRGSIMRAAARLARPAGREMPVGPRLRVPPGSATSPAQEPVWETCIPGGHRLLYCVTVPSRDDGRRRAQILRAVIVVIEGAPGPAALTRAEARELERRRQTLRKIGGGIPHEVVRRAWLAELARAKA
ncbi:MAG TPA: hypothetical protein VH853_12555 [Polyangia bacterium]|jgi:hypothetical protein|nr:hypothetical protein [Polyangia bacterium]